MVQAQKTQQRSGKSPKNSTPKTKQPPVNGKGFYSRSMTHRQDNFEKQAEEAAWRIMRGETGVARFLTPTPAASFRISASTGQPLAHDVRSELEEGFGADLGAVRIHHNRYADSAVENEGAKAFTSGRDIYFSSSRFNPGSVGGRELLIHELAHVLQQTGRQGHDNRLHVQDLKGAGAIQFDNGPGGLPINENIFERISKVHRDNTTDPAVNEFIVQIGTRLGNELIFLQQTDASRTLAEEVLQNRFRSQTRAARSFLFDCLKLLGHFESASHLIDQDFRLKTVVGVIQFIQYLINTEQSGLNVSWIISILHRHPVLSGFWPARFEFTFQEFLFNPKRPILSLPLFGDTFNRLNEESANLNILSENERVLLGMNFLEAEDQVRIDKLRQIDREIRRFSSTGSLTIAQWQLARANKMQQWGQNILDNTVAPEVASFVQEYGTMIRDLGEQAVSFWTEVALAFGMALEQFSLISATDISDFRREELAQPLPEHEKFTALQAMLENQAEQLFEMNEDGAPPSISQYTGRIARFRTQIRRHARELSTELGQLFRSQSEEESNLTLAQAFARMLQWLDRLEIVLQAYDVRLDRRESRSYASADQRMGHRIIMARNLFFLAIQAGWRVLETITQDVLINAEQGQSIVVLLSNWEQQSNVPVDVMMEDFSSSRPVFPDTPLTVFHIVTFFQMHYLQNLNAAIESLLETAETNLDPQQPDVLREAKRQAADTPRPKRYQVSNFEYAFNENDPRRPIDLLEEHPKTWAFLERNVSNSAEWEGYILPVRLSDAVFMWLIPPLEEMIRVLRRIPELNSIVEGHGVPTPTSDIQWLLALSLNDSELVRARDLINSGLTEAHGKQAQRLQGLLRRINTLRRRRLAPVLSRLLQDYGEGDITDFSKPNDVLTAIENYSRAVQPEADEDHQVAALILQLAPALRAAFLREGWFGTTIEERFDLITGYFEYLILARDHLEGNNLARLQDILHTDESLGQLLANGDTINDVIDGFNEVRARKQREFGFKSEDGQNLMSIRSPREINPASIFEIDGNEYELVEVHRTFIYHPTYGEGTGAELPGVLKDLNGNTLTPEQLLFTIYINGSETQVTGRDVELLDRLTHVITMRAILIGLENLAQIMEEAALLALDLAELIPGIGQGITIARIIAGVAIFIANDLPAIRDDLLNDPFAMVEELKETIEGEISPENIFEFLIFSGDNPFERFRRQRSRSARSGRRSRGKLGKLIQAVKQIGRRVAESLMALRRRMQGPILSAQASIASRPTLAYALQELPDVIIALSSLTNSRRKQIFAGLLSNPESMTDSISTLLSGLQELELPREVIPMDLTVEVVMAFFLDRFGGKGRILRRVLEAAGFLNQVADPIAEALRGSAVDPNTYWTREFLPVLQRHFVEARDSLVDTVYSVINQAVSGLPGTPISPPAGEDLPPIPDAEEIGSTDFPESELYVSPVLEPLPGPTPVFMAHSGVSLSRGLQDELGKRFGHDFGHVRLHTGDDAAQLTQRFGAEGLTSGSHVFLRPGFSPDSGPGAKVFRHELAHVLQQSGPRPLGENHDNKPVVGRPGKGIRYDSRREAAAQRMADAAQHRGYYPLLIEEEGGDGLQPSMTNLALRVLRTLSQREFGDDFLQRVRAAQQGAANVPGRQQAEQLWDDVLVELRGNLPENRYAGFLQASEVRDAIRTHITQTRKRDIDQAIPGLTSLAQRPIRGRRQRRGGGSVARQETELRPRRFANLLEAFIFARTGVALQIKMHGDTPRLRRLEVQFVDLGRVDYRTDLYRLAKRETNAHNYTNAPALNDRDWREIGRWLESVGGEPFVWDNNEYRLSQRFIDAFFERRHLASQVVLPDWNNYTTHDLRSEEPGLRVGTHGELTGLARSARVDRQSHHIPQYLLVEYFSNRTTPKLFGSGNAHHLPGFEPPAANNPTRFNSGIGTIDFGRLDTGGRANGMPAILLATETHTRGKLHLNREFRWSPDLTVEERGTSTQGNSINNFFFSTLRNRLNLQGNTSFEVVAQHAQQNPDDARPAIYQSMKATYNWMYEDRMKPALETALTEIEAPYYASIAARDHSDAQGRLDRAYDSARGLHRLNDVLSAVAQKNDNIMSDWD
jgi:hypothetical protein